MFVELVPEQTGVIAANPYDDPRMWSERYHEYGVGAIGSGVAVGDFDNDGKPDIFVVSKVESCRLFRNKGGFVFEDVTDRAGVGDRSREWKQGAAFADVDNDGWLDLYVCRFSAPNLLFMNQRDGTFREEGGARGLAVRDACGMAAFCDYDRDGWLDVYIVTNLLDAAAHPRGQRDYLFRNAGDGHFQDVTVRAGISGESQGHSATWWDHDEDGWPDLYVANDFGTPDRLYRNRHDGTFEDVIDRAVPRMPFSSMGADLGDINNDGRMDLLVADMETTTLVKHQRGMADSMGQRREEAPGQPDKALQCEPSSLYLSTGTGRFLEVARLTGLAATDWTWSVRFEDLDNDGRVDLFVTNGMNREQTNVDLLQAMMVAESPAERARLMRDSPVLREANLTFRNRGDLRFENVSVPWGLDQTGVSFGSASGDFDGDGDLDIVYVNFEDNPSVLRNDSDSGHRVEFALSGVASNRFGIGTRVELEAGGLRQVRQLVLARGYGSTSEPILHFGLGDASTIDRLVVAWPSGRRQEFSRIAADVRYEVVEPEAANEPVAQGAARVPQFSEVGGEFGLNLTTREEVIEGTVSQPLLPMRFNRRGPGLAIGDCDGDGVDEIVFGATTRDVTRILRSTGERYVPMEFTPPFAPPPANDGPPLLVDVNADGALDLLLSAGGASYLADEPEYRPRLLIRNSDGGYRMAAEGTLPDVRISAGAVAGGDVDRDGRLDVFLGARVVPGFFPENPDSALLMSRDGRLVDMTEAIAPGLRNVGMVTSALWSDVNNDGWIDLLVALDWGAVRYFQNETGKRLVDRSDEAGFLAAGSGWWTSLAAADFNGDGRLDYVAGNLGQNTEFAASAEKPILFFVGDFAGSGTPQIVDALYDGDRLVPRRSRRELGAKIPSILRRFPKNDRYASATLEEILGADKVSRATRYAATELRSGVFLSRTDGRFHFEPLPRQAQIAPIQGLVAGDFDADGHADILAVQNSYAPMPGYGRFDGGLGVLLCGDGRGGFVPVGPAESGLLVPGDAKALVTVDLNRDHWPDFLVSRNNCAALAFVNAGVPGARPFEVRLRGAPGNPLSAGARIEVEFSDSTRRVVEVAAGGGYGSQSTPSSFFGCGPGVNPVRVCVRWPRGQETRHDVPPGEAGLTLDEPAR